MRTGVIYLYTFPNGKVYVGQTRRNPKVRHREHLDSKTGPTNGAFWKAYQEQGEPKYEILETHQLQNVEELIDVLNERETYFINQYQATFSRNFCTALEKGKCIFLQQSILFGSSQTLRQDFFFRDIFIM